MPVLFTIKNRFSGGGGTAFLNTTETAAFPEEQEYLIGNKDFTIRKISQEKLTYRDQFGVDYPMEVTVIILK